MNTDCTAYIVIDETLIETICEQLQIAFILFSAFRSLRDYNGQIALKPIIHVIYLTLKVNEYAKQTCSMLIVSLNNHRIIINKSWMNRHKVILNMLYDRIMFKSNRCKHLEAIFNHVFSKSNQNSTSSRRSSTRTFVTSIISVIKKIFKYIIFKRKSVFNQVIKESAVDSRSASVLLEISINFVKLNSFESRSEAQSCRVEFVSNQNQTNHQLATRAESRQLTICLNIASVSAAAFYRLNNRAHRHQNVQCFSLIVFIIIEELMRRVKSETTYSKLNALTKLMMNQVLEKLFKEFHDLKKTFDRLKVFQLPSHKLYDHKIELKDS